jgi:hypothetical protein
MNKRVLQIFLILFTSLFINANAKVVPIEQARKVAKNIYYERVNLVKEMPIQSINFTHEFIITENELPVYYVFNVNNNEGFVIISAESNAFPIIAYSYESYYNPDKLNPGFEAEMKNYQAQISYIREKNLQADDNISSTWEKYLSSSFTKSTSSITTVGPLVKTKWDQGCYYNTLCPVGDGGYGYCNHVPTGCVATAMAQLMKYWSFPSTGKGQNQYTSMVAHNVNFAAQTYNWAAMPASLTAENNEVAKIMYHAGVSVNMNYSPGGSSASTQDAAFKLVNNWKYSSTTSYQSKGTNNVDWHFKVRGSLIDGRPLIYRGSGTYGHAFICDGFQYPDYYHFNWGWGGSYDGYFYISSLNPGSYNFTNDQGAIFNCYPPTTATPTSIEDTESQEFIQLFPNPNNGNFNITIEGIKLNNANIIVSDITSKVVTEIPVNSENINISLPNVEKGIYFIRIESENFTSVKKIIVK